ncbi:MAG TPA: hypothetical protein PLI74_10105, partial [Candidatus Kapabacteria bacterium]|nr:hypothetical protein [Candidatus Kapabacteria bacterium]
NAQYVKIGGSIIYATCSILPQENEEVVLDFLKNNPNFEPDFLSDIFAEHNITIDSLDSTDFFLTLYSSIHKTDGFFVARMRRVQ